MTTRIIFALQKGGVGKTTSTVSTAEILAALGYRVLVVDFDSQGNATKMLTRKSIYQFTGHTIMEAIQRRVRIKEISANGVNLEEPAMEDYVALAEEIIKRTKKEG